MFTLKRLAMVLAVAMLGACSQNEENSQAPASAPVNEAPVSQVSETAKLNTWLDAQFEDYLDFSPMAKSRLGIKEDYDQLDDVSEAAADKQLDWRRQSVEEMKATFDRDKLDDEGKISYDLWVFMLEQRERLEPYRRHNFIFGRYGPQSGLPSSLISYHKVESADDMEAYISRLNQVGRIMGQYLERTKKAVADGIRAPYFDYERAIREANNVTSGAPFTASDEPSPLWNDITGKIDNLVESGEIDAGQAEKFRTAARQSLLTVMKPSYDEIIAWLEADLAENVPDEATGEWNLPNGEAAYAAALNYMTTLPLTADEIHQTGLSEVARIHEEMNTIRQNVGFEGSLNDFFVFMREDEQFYYDNTDEGREAYLEQAREYIGAMEEKLPDYFGLLPKASLEVRRVEAFREQAGGAAHYRRGTPDGERPGIFYAHLADMNAVAAYRLENLAYHEGLPGHHLQISIQQELTEIPRFRTYHGYTAFSEGWGLYAEYMGKDMGFYENPYNDFGRLTGELWRAIRLVVDTGIHAKGWTEQKAIDYAILNSPRPARAVRSEIHRYFNNPAQATAYKIGMLKILELRARAKEELGEKFDYRGFHDAVLGSGPLPLPILERKIDRWIASQS